MPALDERPLSSTEHLAINPSPDRHRFAVPFFFAPNIYWPIRCVPTCCDAGNPARYPEVTCEQYLTVVPCRNNYHAAADAPAEMAKPCRNDKLPRPPWSASRPKRSWGGSSHVGGPDELIAIPNIFDHDMRRRSCDLQVRVRAATTGPVATGCCRTFRAERSGMGVLRCAEPVFPSRRSVFCYAPSPSRRSCRRSRKALVTSGASRSCAGQFRVWARAAAGEPGQRRHADRHDPAAARLHAGWRCRAGKRRQDAFRQAGAGFRSGHPGGRCGAVLLRRAWHAGGRQQLAGAD